jgi:ectoine hydroxylase-related dioxygenase (phytanoyl-CoA dioxygenase family)
VIGQPFKLSSMLARTLEPGAPAQQLHVDVKRDADGWPLIGFIVMVDDFHAENGATRFVPGSHLLPREPAEWAEEATGPDEGQLPACGPAGSIIIFNGSVWHGHGANRSMKRRRSIQGGFCPERVAGGDQPSQPHAPRDV